MFTDNFIKCEPDRCVEISAFKSKSGEGSGVRIQERGTRELVGAKEIMEGARELGTVFNTGFVNTARYPLVKRGLSLGS